MAVSPFASACSAELVLSGTMPHDKHDNLNYDVSYRQTGLMTRIEFEPTPPAVRVMLWGKQRFSFDYSSNIQWIRLAIARKTLYEGAPIKAFDASGEPIGPLEVRFAWTGKEVRLHVEDDCYPG